MKNLISLSILRAVVGITLISYPYALQAMPPKNSDDEAAARQRAKAPPISLAARQEALLDIVERYMDIPPDAARGVAHEAEFIRYKEKGYSDIKVLYLRERDIITNLVRAPKPAFKRAWDERQVQFTNFFLRVFEMFSRFQKDIYQTEGLSAEDSRRTRRELYPTQVHPHLELLQRDIINPFFAKLAAIEIIKADDPYGIIPIKDGCFLGFQKEKQGAGYLPFVGKIQERNRLYRIHYGLDNIMENQSAFLIGHGGVVTTHKGFYFERRNQSDDFNLQLYNGVNDSFTLNPRTLRLREVVDIASHDFSADEEQQNDPSSSLLEIDLTTPAISITSTATLAAEPSVVAKGELSEELQSVEKTEDTSAYPLRSDALPLPREAIESQGVAAIAAVTALSPSDETAIAFLPPKEEIVTATTDVSALFPSDDTANALPLPEERIESQDITATTNVPAQPFSDETAIALPLPEERIESQDITATTNVSAPSPSDETAKPSSSVHLQNLERAPFSSFSIGEETHRSSSQGKIFRGETLYSFRAIKSMLEAQERQGEESLFIALPTTAQDATLVELLMLEGDGETEDQVETEARGIPQPLFLEQSRLHTVVEPSFETEKSASVPMAAEDSEPKEAPLRERLIQEIIDEISPPKVAPQASASKGKSKGKKQHHHQKKSGAAASDLGDDTTAEKIASLRNEAGRILHRRLADTKLKYGKLLQLLNAIQKDVNHSATQHGLPTASAAPSTRNGSHLDFHDELGTFGIARPHGRDFQYPPRVANGLLERFIQSMLENITRSSSVSSLSSERSSKDND